VDFRLGVDNDGVVEGFLEIEYWLEHLVVDFDKARGFFCGRFVFCSDNGYLVADIAHILIQNESIVGAWLGVALACSRNGDAGAILPCEDACNTWHLERFARVDRHDARKGVRAPDELDIECILRREVIGIGRPAEHKTFSVYFGNIVCYHVEFLCCIELFGACRGR